MWLFAQATTTSSVDSTVFIVVVAVVVGECSCIEPPPTSLDLHVYPQ